MGISGAAIATLATQGFGTWILPLIWKEMRPSSIEMMKSVNPVKLLGLGSKA